MERDLKIGEIRKLVSDKKKKRRKKSVSASQRSLKHLRANGWQAAPVEKWLPPRGNMKFGRRVDVWGFGDILACRPQMKVGNKIYPPRIALVQSTTMSEWERHLEKFNTPEIKKFADNWKASNGLIFLQAWGLRKRKGGLQGEKVQTLREKVL